MILFDHEQNAVDLSSEHTNAQHTWIWWPNVYTICLESLLCGQLLANQISFCDCRTGHFSPWAGCDGSFIGTYKTTTHSYLVAECEISAWTTLGNDYQKFLWVIFECFTIPLSTKLWVYRWNMSKLHIIEYGAWVLLFKVNYSVFCQCLPRAQYHACMLQSGALKRTSRTF